jgi:hypothetical protein
MRGDVIGLSLRQCHRETQNTIALTYLPTPTGLTLLIEYRIETIENLIVSAAQFHVEVVPKQQLFSYA